VTPRPIAAGVFGMARTTGTPRAASRPPIPRPAMIESTTPWPAMAARKAGSTASAICGFTARMAASGRKPAGRAPSAGAT
jgi:hypothetical protein